MNRLQTGETIVFGNIKILPVELVCINWHQGALAGNLTATKQPHAIIVCDPYNIRVYNTDAEEIALDTLLQTVPNLSREIERMVQQPTS